MRFHPLPVDGTRGICEFIKVIWPYQEGDAGGSPACFVPGVDDTEVYEFLERHSG